MKKTLSDHDRGRLDGLITDVEKHTNTQIVLALIKRSDTYAELPWKAFALGAAIVGLLIFTLDLFFYDWFQRGLTLLTVVATLAGGAVFALLTVLVPRFAKPFLSGSRIEMEVRQYAESLFLSRELFTTRRRNGILLLVSLFERKVVVLPDRGLDNQLPEKSLQSVIATMTLFLKRNEICHAFEAGLKQLTGILGSKGPGTGENELSDEIIEENGV